MGSTRERAPIWGKPRGPKSAAPGCTEEARIVGGQGSKIVGPRKGLAKVKLLVGSGPRGVESVGR